TGNPRVRTLGPQGPDPPIRGGPGQWRPTPPQPPGRRAAVPDHSQLPILLTSSIVAVQAGAALGGIQGTPTRAPRMAPMTLCRGSYGEIRATYPGSSGYGDPAPLGRMTTCRPLPPLRRHVRLERPSPHF